MISLLLLVSQSVMMKERVFDVESTKKKEAAEMKKNNERSE